MPSDYYIRRGDGRERGPFSADALRGLASRGKLLPGDSVRRGDSESQWWAAASIPGLFPASEIPATATIAATPPTIATAPSPATTPAPARGRGWNPRFATVYLLAWGFLAGGILLLLWAAGIVVVQLASEQSGKLQEIAAAIGAGLGGLLAIGLGEALRVLLVIERRTRAIGD